MTMIWRYFDMILYMSPVYVPCIDPLSHKLFLQTRYDQCRSAWKCGKVLCGSPLKQLATMLLTRQEVHVSDVSLAHGTHWYRFLSGRRIWPLFSNFRGNDTSSNFPMLFEVTPESPAVVGFNVKVSSVCVVLSKLERTRETRLASSLSAAKRPWLGEKYWQRHIPTWWADDEDDSLFRRFSNVKRWLCHSIFSRFRPTVGQRDFRNLQALVVFYIACTTYICHRTWQNIVINRSSQYQPIIVLFPSQILLFGVCGRRFAT